MHKSSQRSLRYRVPCSPVDSPLAKQVRAQTETVLYTFTGSGDGGVPYAGLISDKDGNLYGTTTQYGNGPCTFPFTGCGTIFELMPVNDSGNVQWTFKLLYTFQGGSDGADPSSDLVFDSSGNLYGTTAWGGTGCEGTGCGTVFELERSGNEWVKDIVSLHWGVRRRGSCGLRDPRFAGRHIRNDRVWWRQHLLL